MADTKDKQIDQLIEEITSIKSIINKNKSLLRQVLLPVHFRLLSILSGISIIFFSMVFYYFIDRFGSYSFIPGIIKLTLYIAIMLDIVLLGAMKYVNFMKPLIKINRHYTIGRLMSEFFTFRIVHMYVPLLVLSTCICLYLAHHNSAYYIIPTLSITMGLFYNLIGSIIEVRQWLIAGYWLLITGLGALLLGPMPVPVALSISLGCGLMLFALPMKED